MTLNDDGIKFKRKIVSNNGTAQVSIPKEVLDFLGIEIGDYIEMGVDEGNNGKFGYYHEEGE